MQHWEGQLQEGGARAEMQHTLSTLITSPARSSTPSLFSHCNALYNDRMRAFLLHTITLHQIAFFSFFCD